MVTINAIGGLANRMRVIDSAFQLVKNTNRPIVVIWEMSHELNCSYKRLFEPIRQIEVKEISTNYYLKKVNFLIRKSSKLVGVNLPLGYDLYISDKDVIKAIKTKTERQLLPESKEIFVRTVERFSQGNDSFAYFKPIKVLHDKIQTINKAYSENTIGVHIRRTDHKRSCRHSPDEAFIAEMVKEIESDPSVRFYLSTDSLEVENSFKKIFADHIITYDKEFSRNTEKGIQDALIDLYCLSNTRKIIGSYYSSFSEIAAHINQINLTVIRK